jgi:hypothetical protein
MWFCRSMYRLASQRFKHDSRKVLGGGYGNVIEIFACC